MKVRNKFRKQKNLEKFLKYILILSNLKKTKIQKNFQRYNYKKLREEKFREIKTLMRNVQNLQRERI